MEGRPYVVILMGSPADQAHCDQIHAALDELGIANVQRIASAHKTPARLLAMLKEYDSDPRQHVYITVAGRSNALSGMVDGATVFPVIACPPPSSSFGGADIFSSLRVPSGIAPLLVLEPANAALAAAKILAMSDPQLSQRVRQLQADQADRLASADESLRGAS